MLSTKEVPTTIPEGQTLLRYVGKSWGAITIPGPFTGTPYRVSLNAPYLPVKDIDVESGKMSQPGLIQMNRGGSKIFVRHELADAPEPVIDQTDPDPESNQAPAVEPPAIDPDDPPDTTEETEPVVNVDDSLPDPEDVDTLTIGEIKAIPVGTGFDFAKALEVELKTKNRAGAVDYLKGVIA